MKTGSIAATVLAAVSIALSGPIAKSQTLKSLNDLKLAPVEKRDWAFQGFPIMAWWPPPGNRTLKDFQRYRQAGFTIYPANPDAGYDHALKLASQVGLAVMSWRTRQGFDVPAPRQPIVLPENDPNVVAWITGDEPGGYGAVRAQITAVNELMRKDPARWAFFNMFPPHHQNHPNTEQIVDAAVRNGMPVISYDNYVIMADGTDRTGQHFDNLARARALSLKYHVPFWAFALTTKHRGYRRPSESDVRWKQFTNLAYGAKGLWYFCYWGPHRWRGWDTRSIVDANTGATTDLYDQVKALNHAVLTMGDLLLKLTSEAVAHTHPPPGHPAFKKQTYWIADIKAQNALIGFFRSPKGERYALVVNQLHGMNKSSKETADTVELTFGPEVKAVEAVNWLDGKPGMLTLKNRKTRLRIDGGTGVLLRARQ